MAGDRPASGYPPDGVLFDRHRQLAWAGVCRRVPPTRGRRPPRNAHRPGYPRRAYGATAGV